MSNEKNLEESKQGRPAVPHYKGIGGWLIFLVIDLYLSAAFEIYRMYKIFILFKDGTVNYLSDQSSQVYMPGYAGYLKFDFIVAAIFLVVELYLIGLLFKKNRNFPKYFVLFLGASLILIVMKYIILSSLSVHGEGKEFMDKNLSDLSSNIPVVFISVTTYIMYMIKSKRVKATFVEN